MNQDKNYDALTKSPNLVLGLVQGGKAGTFWFDGTPQNIAAFLMQNTDADQIQIITALDTPVLSSFGCLIDHCPNSTLLASVMEQLIPMQMGAVSPAEFFCPTNEEFAEFCRQEHSAEMTLA